MMKPAKLVGWKCPECGKVNAPWMQQCPHEENSAAEDKKSPTTAEDDKKIVRIENFYT
jgi:uncharacterized OB-fold protein